MSDSAAPTLPIQMPHFSMTAAPSSGVIAYMSVASPLCTMMNFGTLGVLSSAEGFA